MPWQSANKPTTRCCCDMTAVTAPLPVDIHGCDAIFTPRPQQSHTVCVPLNMYFSTRTNSSIYLLTRLRRNHLHRQPHLLTRLLDLPIRAGSHGRFPGVDGRIGPQHLRERHAVVERFERQQQVRRGLVEVGAAGELDGVDGLEGRLGIEEDDVDDVGTDFGRSRHGPFQEQVLLFLGRYE